MTDEYVELYQKQRKIQPLEVQGVFQSLRWWTILCTLSFYFVLPWITWNDRQAVLFDLPARKFYIFGFTFWPQDFFYLSWGLILAALALFITTTIVGRLWCGYTCPQTVWTKLFLRLEAMVEGTRGQRLKLDAAPWSLRKLYLRSIKHVLWLTLALATAVTFVGYFMPITQLIHALLSFELHPWAWFWVGFFTLATYTNAGWMREQVCLYMCPYARFQSVMFDRDTLIISYDAERGEARGPRSRKIDPKQQGLGDCINCFQCVHACPTGIDIRDGLQYECIGCAACVDACDRIMDKMGYARGLVRYTTEKGLQDKQPGRYIHSKAIGYGLIFLVFATLFMVSLWLRPLVDVDVIRDRNQLYRITNRGMIENVYKLRILNKSQQDKRYSIALSEPDLFTYQGPKELLVHAGEVKTIAASVSADPELIQFHDLSLTFLLEGGGLKKAYREESRFLKPREDEE